MVKEPLMGLSLIHISARLALKHRLRRLPFEEQGYDEERIDTVVSAVLEG